MLPSHVEDAIRAARDAGEHQDRLRAALDAHGAVGVRVVPDHHRILGYGRGRHERGKILLVYPDLEPGTVVFDPKGQGVVVGTTRATLEET